jgi:thiamine-phosphate pyrophosphorylase
MASKEATSGQTRRIIDANLNRIGEGLRLLENLARLLLNDTDLTQKLKTMRHELITSDWPSYQQLLKARDATGDIGIDIEAPEQEKPKELPTVVVANAKRVQESLRTVEELTKIQGIKPELDPHKFQQARFNLYTIEKVLLSRLTRRDKLEHLPGLYVIIDTQALKGHRHTDMAKQAIKGGAKTIQLRDKIQSKKELLTTAQQIKKLCADHGVLFIINDYLDIALATDADGLHLGQDDLPISTIRPLLPIDKILGFSTHSLEEATTAEAEGADYIAVGAIFPTTSKEKAKVIGLDGLRQIRQAITLPIVAIGGINSDNADEVITAGADSVAVISAVLQAESPERAARRITTRFEGKK